MSEIKKVLVEALRVLAVGVAVALTANFVSPRGLSLARNYFPRDVQPLPPALSTNVIHSGAAPGTNALTPAELTVARLKQQGLGVVDSNEVVRLFHDPRRVQELVVFVDARDEEHYQAGHVPGAFLFDHYHAENYFAAVLPVCGTAEQIVVYCNGGDCEDSGFAAVTLREAGVPKEKLFVYPGGMTEWTTNGLPVEIGARNSGTLREAKK